MGERRSGLRVGVPLLIVAGLFLWLTGNPGGPANDVPEPDEDDTPDKLSVRWLDPIEVPPGGAVVAHVDGLTDEPVSARLSLDDGKQEVPVLRRDGDRLSIRIPRDTPRGATKLRVYQGERKSKPRLMQVRPIPVRDLARDAAGGLAVLLVGLALVGRAFRSYAGQRLRSQLARMTQSAGRGLTLGALVGGLSQSTTSSAGILLGMLRARLLPQRAAVSLMIGVQAGAATAGAVLPMFASREALWVVALGGLWTAMAGDRLGRAFGHMVLGAGLLFLGLSLMQAGVRPLLSEPAILPYLHQLTAEDGIARVSAMGLGALIAALLQGPGPAFMVVLSLTQSTGLLSLSDGLYILAGTPLGATLGTVALGLRAGEGGRRLAFVHVLVGLVMSVITFALVPAWAGLAVALVDGDPNTLRYGARVLRPDMAGHLAVGFVAAQTAAALACLPLQRVIDRLATRWTPTSDSDEYAPSGRDETLVPVLSACRQAVLSLGEVVVTRDRAPAVVAERAIAEARSAVTGLLRGLERDPDLAPSDLATVTACLHLATATDGALRVAERALERDLATDDSGARHLARVQALLVEGMEALVQHAEGQRALNLEDMQAREIRLNALEAEARAPTGGHAGTLGDRLWLSELSSACEAIGNHIYRLGNALASTPMRPSK